MTVTKECLIGDCGAKARKRGWCVKHYERWRAHGDPLVKKKTGPKALKTLVQPGHVYGRLTVVEDTGERRWGQHPVFLCRCECGQTADVVGHNLRSGQTRSCGCLQRDVARGLVSPAKELSSARRWQRRYIYAKYGLTTAEADALLAAGCAICESDVDVCIDHDHINGKARAALCRKCNTMLGMAGDSAERLRVAADYLDSHRKPE